MKEFGAAEATDGREQLLELSLSEAKIEGLILEFGVYEGASLSFISELSGQEVHGFDSFDGLPEDWRSGFRKGHFALKEIPSFDFNAQLHVGLFAETIPGFIQQRGDTELAIRFLHIDCDLYSSTKEILWGLAAFIKSGTVILFDEYLNYPGWEKGEWLAFHEFIKESGRKYRYLAFNRVHEQVAVIME